MDEGKSSWLKAGFKEVRLVASQDDALEEDDSLYGPHAWTGGCGDLHHCKKQRQGEWRLEAISIVVLLRLS